MVQRKGTWEASGTRLMIVREWTSKKVMPRKAGVSNVRATAPCSNSAGVAGCPERCIMVRCVPNCVPTCCASHRMDGNLGHLFDSVKHEFDTASCGAAVTVGQP